MICNQEFVDLLTLAESRVMFANLEKSPDTDDKASFYSWYQFKETPETLAINNAVRARAKQ